MKKEKKPEWNVKYDTSIYDAPPDINPDQYDSGLCYMCYVMLWTEDLHFFLPFRTILMRSNCCAMVVTDICAKPTDPYPFVVVYIFHKTRLAQEVFEKLLDHKDYVKSHVQLEHINQGEQIWYHKHWQNPGYNPDRLDTPGKAYMILAPTISDPIERKALRLHYMTMKGCYHPISDEDQRCKGGYVNYMLCTRCCLSTYYERYNRKGNRIDKSIDLRKRKR